MPSSFKCSKSELGSLQSLEIDLYRAEILNIYDLHSCYLESLPEQGEKGHLAELKAKELLEHDLTLASRVIVPTKPIPELIQTESVDLHQSIIYPIFMDSSVPLNGISSWLHKAWEHDEMELEEKCSNRARSPSPASMRSRSRSPSLSRSVDPEPVPSAVNDPPLPIIAKEPSAIPTVQVFSQSVLSSQTVGIASQKSQKPKRKRGF
jgi:hypothetical protein